MAIDSAVLEDEPAIDFPRAGFAFDFPFHAMFSFGADTIGASTILGGALVLALTGVFFLAESESFDGFRDKIDGDIEPDELKESSDREKIVDLTGVFLAGEGDSISSNDFLSRPTIFLSAHVSILIEDNALYSR